VRIFIDSARLADIEKYNDDPMIEGFTTNATLVRQQNRHPQNATKWAEEILGATAKEVSIEYMTCDWRPNVRWKVTNPHLPESRTGAEHYRWNLTAICSPQQIPAKLPANAIISVFAGRIMDTGVHPAQIIGLAKRTGAQVLWASSRSVYDITMAEINRCDIITVTPAIYEKYREWNGKPLEQVAAETIAQFERDRGTDERADLPGADLGGPVRDLPVGQGV
jgi:transaldolase